MNNRDYKEFATGEYYHIYNRGVGKMKIFSYHNDYTFFITRMRENLYPKDKKIKSPLSERRILLPAGAFSLISYCLMPNHFHLLIRQEAEIPVSKFVSKICTGYSKCFNKKYDRVGSVFQDQFKAVSVKTNEQLLYLTFYIHNNPRKAGLVKDLAEYPYSSHPDYVGLRDGTLCKKEIVLSQFSDTKSYLGAIMNFEDDGLSLDLRID